MAFLFKRKSKDIDVNGQPVVESAFARRQSAAQKFEMEQQDRPRFKTLDDVDERPKIDEEDEDIPPPPDDDDAPPPPPPPPASLLDDEPKAKKGSTPPPKSASPAKSASPSNAGNPPPSRSPPLGGKPPAAPSPKSKDKHSSTGSTSSAKGKPADPEYIEFTVVPLLLRSGVAYDEANKYGELIKHVSEAEVMRVMSSAMLLQDDVEKRKIKVPASFETTLLNDQFWVKGKKAGDRKSFVYYAPVTADASSPKARPDSTRDASSGGGPTSASRARMSFSAGPVHVPSGNEGDASRYKVATRRDKAESVSKDLQDLVETLSKLDADGRES